MEPTASVPHEEATIRELKSSALEAAAYLTAVIEDGDPKEVLVAQRRITAAFGGVPNLAEQIDRSTGTQLAMRRHGASSARPNRAWPAPPGEEQEMSIETKSARITPVGGNVFADMGFEPEEAAALKAESQRIVSEKLAIKYSPMTVLH